VLEALAEGESFTAKIAWLADVPSSFREKGKKLEDEGGEVDDDEGEGDDKDGGEAFGRETARARWIHCTPMLGKGGEVGVWMVVFV